MIRHLIFTLIALMPLAGFAAPATADEAQQRLHSAVDEVLAIADKASSKSELGDRLTPVLEKNISFAAMTRRAIGPGWREFKPEQQKKATALLSKLVIRTYSNKFTIGEHAQILFKSAATPAPGRVDVSTTTISQGSRYAVIYRMEQEEGWRITDVVIEGVSMVANYRSQLDPVYKKGGAAAVLSSLEQSVAHPQ